MPVFHFWTPCCLHTKNRAMANLQDQKLMADRQCKKILFLCPGNSACSTLCEATFNRLGGVDFRAFSAGSQQAEMVDPCAIKLLGPPGDDARSLYSKSPDEFLGPTSAVIDRVFGDCSNAAGEILRPWHGNPGKERWDNTDHTDVEGTDFAKRGAFTQTFLALVWKINSFLEQLHGDSG